MSYVFVCAYVCLCACVHVGSSILKSETVGVHFNMQSFVCVRVCVCDFLFFKELISGSGDCIPLSSGGVVFFFVSVCSFPRHRNLGNWS